jgi:predicted nucleotidyltransferase
LPNNVATEDPVQQLSERLGIEWQAIANAATSSAARIRSLDAELGKFTTEDTSVVIFGSLARHEFTSGSDLDWVLLVDGIADPEHLRASLDIEAELKEQGVKGPGAEGAFSGLAFSHDLINYIGGSDDTNANLTRRMLLLLESACIGRDDAYRVRMYWAG